MILNKTKTKILNKQVLDQEWSEKKTPFLNDLLLLYISPYETSCLAFEKLDYAQYIVLVTWPFNFFK